MQITLHILRVYVRIILKDNNKVFLVKHHDTDWAAGQWNFPEGLLEKEGEPSRRCYP